MKLKLENYAIASDGGSIWLQTHCDEDKPYDIFLDNGIESESRGLVSVSSKQINVEGHEKEEVLGALSAIECSIDGGNDIVDEVMEALKVSVNL